MTRRSQPRAFLPPPTTRRELAARLGLRPSIPRGHQLMRHPLRATQAASKALPAPPSAAVIATTRLGFGPRPGDIAAFQALGTTDPARLSAWIDQQLAPAGIDDSTADARLSASGLVTLGKAVTELWSEHVQADTWEVHMRPFWETRLATWIRAIHSRRQLFELMVDFWHNHFNIYADDFLVGPMFVQVDRDCIRANALGNFRQMLGAVAKSTAMLYYLDNRENSLDGPNENYGRELLELHGLGAEHYYGNIPAATVPVDGGGVPLGYCDEDVTAAARCLTGWTVRDRDWDPDFGDTGEFFTHEDWHDTGPKTVLGVSMPAGRNALTDGEHLLDLIAAHPGTARFIARKLVRRLVMDFPAQTLIDDAAATFAANVGSATQIAQTIRTIVLHPLFVATWGEKIKRPFELATSALRGAGGDLPFTLEDSATDWFEWMYGQSGQPLFGWHPPNGYPDFRAAWKSTSPRVRWWRLANMLVEVEPDGAGYAIDSYTQTPGGVRTARQLVQFWGERILGQPLAPTDEAELIDFMAQGFNPDFALPLDSDNEVRDRLRALVALIFMSPSFQWR